MTFLDSQADTIDLLTYNIITQKPTTIILDCIFKANNFSGKIDKIESGMGRSAPVTIPRKGPTIPKPIKSNTEMKTNIQKIPGNFLRESPRRKIKSL